MPLAVRKLGKEIGRADKAGARAVVIVGQQDWETGDVTVRDLRSGDQQTVDLNDVADAVQKVMEQPSSGEAD